MTKNSNLPYPVGAIANYMLDRGAKERIPITHLKLQKLVYMAYGWATLIYDEPLFSSTIEAWSLGPVVPDLWHEFKVYGEKPIGRGRAFEFDWETSTDSIIPSVPATDTQTHLVLAITWALYGPEKAWKLVDLTHDDNTPWKQTPRNEQIRYELIRDHFREKFIPALENAKELNIPT